MFVSAAVSFAQHTVCEHGFQDVEFIGLAESRGSEATERALMFKGQGRGVNVPLTPPPWPKYKSLPYLHMLHQNIPAPPLWEAGIWTNHPASIEWLHFHQMQCKRVERSSELMDDLIMVDWLYRFRWSYPHCLSGRRSQRRMQSLTGWNHHIQETNLIQITLI